MPSPPPNRNTVSPGFSDQISYYCLGTVSEYPITLHMTGNELLRRLRRLGSRRGVVVYFDEERGKGSHGTLYFGERFTVLKDRRAEIRPGLLHAMLRQLGLSERDLR